jgi:hypothetical protein
MDEIGILAWAFLIAVLVFLGFSLVLVFARKIMLMFPMLIGFFTLFPLIYPEMLGTTWGIAAWVAGVASGYVLIFWAVRMLKRWPEENIFLDWSARQWVHYIFAGWVAGVIVGFVAVVGFI